MESNKKLQRYIHLKKIKYPIHDNNYIAPYQQKEQKEITSTPIENKIEKTVNYVNHTQIKTSNRKYKYNYTKKVLIDAKAQIKHFTIKKEPENLKEKEYNRFISKYPTNNRKIKYAKPFKNTPSYQSKITDSIIIGLSPIVIMDTVSKEQSINYKNNIYKIIDKNLNNYNLSLINPSESINKKTSFTIQNKTITLPDLHYDGDYYAFINSGQFDYTIVHKNVSEIIPAHSNTLTYFTYYSNVYKKSSTFNGYIFKLNKYNNTNSNRYILYLGGWSKRLSHIKNLYVYNNNILVTKTDPIYYYNNRYLANVTLILPEGLHHLTISDVNGELDKIDKPILVTIPKLTLDHYDNEIKKL
jgi:hypothetical protein